MSPQFNRKTRSSSRRGAKNPVLSPNPGRNGASFSVVPRRKKLGDDLVKRKLEKRKQKQIKKRLEACGRTFVEKEEHEKRKKENMARDEYLRLSQDVTIAQKAFILIKNIRSKNPPLHADEAWLFKMIDCVEEDGTMKKPLVTLPSYLQPKKYLHLASLRASLILNDFTISRDLPFGAVRAGWLWGFQCHRSFDVYWVTVRFYCTAFKMMKAAGKLVTDLQNAYINAVAEATAGSKSFKDRNTFIEIWHACKDPKNDILPLSKVQTDRAKAFLERLEEAKHVSNVSTAAEAAKILRVTALTAPDPSSFNREAKALEDMRERSKIYLAEQGLAADDRDGVTKVTEARYEELCKDREGDRYMPDEWVALLPAKKVQFYFYELMGSHPVALEQTRYNDCVPEGVRLAELKKVTEMSDREFDEMLEIMQGLNLNYEPMELCSVE